MNGKKNAVVRNLCQFPSEIIDMRWNNNTACTICLLKNGDLYFCPIERDHLGYIFQISDGLSEGPYHICIAGDNVLYVNGEGGIKEFELGNMSPIYEINVNCIGDNKKADAIEYDEIGDRVYLGCWGEIIRVIDHNTGHELMNWKCEDCYSSIYGFAFSKNNKSFLVMSNLGWVNSYDRSTWHHQWSCSIESNPRFFGFSGDDYIIGTNEGLVRVDPSNGTWKKETSFQGAMFSFDPVYGRAAVATGLTGGYSQVFIEELKNYKNSVTLSEQGMESGYSDLEFSKSGRYLAIASSMGEIEVWDTTMNELISQYTAHEGIIAKVKIADFGPTIISVGYEDQRVVKAILQ